MSYFEDFEEIHIGKEEWHPDFEPIQARKIFVFETLTDKWKTINGTILNPKDMNKNHIINSLNMMMRCCKEYKLNVNKYPIYKVLREELEEVIKILKSQLNNVSIFQEDGTFKNKLGDNFETVGGVTYQTTHGM